MPQSWLRMIRIQMKITQRAGVIMKFLIVLLRNLSRADDRAVGTEIDAREGCTRGHHGSVNIASVVLSPDGAKQIEAWGFCTVFTTRKFIQARRH